MFTVTSTGAAVALVVGLVGWRALGTVDQSREVLARDGAVQRAAVLADMAHDALRGDLYRALVVSRSDPAVLASVREDTAHHERDLRASLALVRREARSQQSQDALAQLQPEVDAYLRVVTDAVALCERSPQEALAQQARVQQRFVAAGAKLETLRAALAVEGRQADAAAVSSARSARAYGMLSVLLGGVLALALGWELSRRSVRSLLRELAQLRASGDGLSAAAEQVQHASQSLERNTAAQSAALKDTFSALEEIASMAQRNAVGAGNAQSLSSESSAAVTAGDALMADLERAMEAIKDSSDGIAKIIRSIDEIAFQTNILALNAAVEAARAGEAGLGFAVVADEVRSLAQRSAQAARDTAERIDDAIVRNRLGVELTRKVRVSLHTIVASTARTDQLIGEIAGASSMQALGVEQTKASMVLVSDATKGNQGMVREVASAADQLHQQAARLDTVVAQLGALVGTADVSEHQHEPEGWGEHEAAVG